jgi:AcrR family transcriptional regulator
LADGDADLSPAAKRRYNLQRRTEAVAARKAAIVDTAIAMLRDAERVSDVTFDAVARVAGVSRPTLYSQFGSRDGLLEAVFDALARAGGITQLSEAAAKDRPEEGLAMLVRVFRNFWSSDAAIGRVYAAIASDPAIKATLAPRLSLGRLSIERLVDRLVPDWTTRRRKDVADLIEVLTDFPSVSRLSASRIPTEVDAAILAACQSILAMRCLSQR